MSRHVLRSIVGVLALTVAATACSTNPGEAVIDEAGTGYRDLAGSCDDAMAGALQSWVKEGFGGSIAVVGFERECVIGLGVADRETGREVDADTSFSIGSITKAVTAAAILNLVDGGRIALDDTAGMHVDGLTGDVADAEIRHLLVHSSGLVGYHGEDHVALSRTEAIEAISALDVAFEPGTDFSYTNAGYTLLALIVDSVAEQGFRGYVAGESGDFDGPHWALDGNGGMAMTPLQMVEWTRALFSGEILSDAGTALLRTIRQASGGGGSIGHLMDVAWLPDSERVIVVAQNASSRNADGLFDAVTEALITGTDVSTPPVVLEADQATLDRHVGTYQLPNGSEVRIAIDQLDPRGLEVTATGAEAIAAIFPLPAGLDTEIERHETNAVRFVNGETAEWAELRAYLEAEYGPITGMSIVASYFSRQLLAEGELVTLFNLELADGSTTPFGVALNDQGGTEAFYIEREPSRFYVIGEDGSFTPHQPFEGEPEIHLSISSDDELLVLTGPSTKVTAERVG